MPDAPFDLVDAKDTFADSDWFQTCWQTQTPYVVVRSGETSADVLWDYVTLPPCCDSSLNQDFHTLEREARAIFDRFAIPESRIRVKPTLICFDRLPFEHAKRAASELYSLIATYLPLNKNAAHGLSHAAGQTALASDAQHGERASANPRRLWIEESGGSRTA